MAPRSRRSPGPASGLTPAIHDRIVQSLASGCTLDVAAQSVGVARETLSRWLSRGAGARDARERGDALDARQRAYVALLDAADEARSRAEVRALATIQRAAADGTWQAAAWYLERVHPERYAARKPKHDRPGRPIGATSAPDRPSTAAPPAILRVVT